MVDGLLFGTIIFVVLAILVFWKIKDFKNWWTNQDGKGATASAILGILVIVVGGVILSLVIGFFQKASAADFGGNYFNSAYAYAGVDHTFKVSAQCKPGIEYADDRLTSNMGFGMNVFESNSKNVLVDVIYHHQSCVLGSDRNSYDGVGLQVKWVFWNRKR